MTDFAVLLGGAFCDYGHMSINMSNKHMTQVGYWWTKTKPSNSNDSSWMILPSGGPAMYNVDFRDIGCRPSLPFSVIKSSCLTELTYNDLWGLYEIEYGEYPRSVVSDSLKLELEGYIMIIN